MKVLVVGATGRSGRAVVEALVARDHEVTAFGRRPAATDLPPGVRVEAGDASTRHDLARCVPGQDAVVVTLGISENAVRVRLMGSRHTPMDIRSRGTDHVIDVMREHQVPKLVVQTSYGVGPTRALLPPTWRLIFAAVLRPQIDDTEIQQEHVVRSDLTWIVVQPVSLTDGTDDRPAHASTDGVVRGMTVSRRSVAGFVADAVGDDAFDGQVVTLS